MEYVTDWPPPPSPDTATDAEAPAIADSREAGPVDYRTGWDLSDLYLPDIYTLDPDWPDPDSDEPLRPPGFPAHKFTLAASDWYKERHPEVRPLWDITGRPWDRDPGPEPEPDLEAEP